MFALKRGTMPAVLSSIQFDHESLNSLGSEGRDPTEIHPRPRPLGGVHAVLDLRDRPNSSYAFGFSCHNGTGHLFCGEEMLGFTGTVCDKLRTYASRRRLCILRLKEYAEFSARFCISVSW